MKKALLLFCIFMSIILLTVSAQAKDPKVAIGIGAGAAPQFEGSDDYDGVPLLYLNAQWDNYMSISILGAGGRVNLLPHPVFRAGLAMEYIGERSDPDNSAVDALPDVDASFMFGGFLGFDYNHWNASVELMTDVADGNDGSIVRLRGGYTMPINNITKLKMGLFTTWADDDYMESYFSINTAGAAASGLSTYDAESGFKDMGLNLSIHYTPWEHWGIMGLFVYKTLIGDADDSPIVDTEGDDGQAVLGVMATYRF
jgi:outer membrane protein